LQGENISNNFKRPAIIVAFCLAGVRYVKNKLSGECTPMSLFQQSFDAKLNVAAFRANGSYVLSMKNPLSFFFLDSNFTYVGQVCCSCGGGKGDGTVVPLYKDFGENVQNQVLIWRGSIIVNDKSKCEKERQ
jgi:hypothetical protein